MVKIILTQALYRKNVKKHITNIIINSDTFLPEIDGLRNFSLTWSEPYFARAGVEKSHWTPIAIGTPPQFIDA